MVYIFLFQKEIHHYYNGHNSKLYFRCHVTILITAGTFNYTMVDLCIFMDRGVG